MSENVEPTSEDRSREPSGNWAALFQNTTQAVFLLSRRRRFRYVNSVWQTLTGQSSEAILGRICRARATLEADPAQRVANTLLPPAEVFDGRSVTVRRPIPFQKQGPPWWDITYLPLKGSDGLLGIIGRITQVGPSVASIPGPGLSPTLVQIRYKMTARYSFEMLRSDQPALQRIAEQARLAAKHHHPVWISGPAGSGKETLARIIHFQGANREQVFLPINGAGLQPYLIRGLLFGKTGFAESGRIGTLFLKNLHAVPLDLQREILDWIEPEAYPMRIAIAHDPGIHPPQKNSILPELIARLSVFQIELPALGSPEMMPRFRASAERMLDDEGFQAGVDLEVWSLFEKYDWPGNFHELRDTLRGCIRAAGNLSIAVAHVPVRLRDAVARRTASGHVSTSISRKKISLESILEQVEKKMILRAMKSTNPNRAELADRLSMPRATLLRRLKALGLDSDPETSSNSG